MRERFQQSAASRSLRHAEVEGFQVTEAFHPGGSHLPWHHHDGPTICYVLGGAFAERSGHRTLRCTTGTLKVTPAGEPHANEFDSGDARGLMIEVASGRLAALRPHAEVLDEPFQAAGGQLVTLARRIRRELQETDGAASLALEGLLLELIAEAQRSQARDPAEPRPWLARAREILHDTPTERHTLTAIAEAVDVHPVTLARAFRRTFGCSVGQYLRRLRLEEASRLLLATDRSITEVALATGYSDQSHFSNAFRRHTGVPPGRYRTMASGG